MTTNERKTTIAADDDATVVADGLEALREALTADGMDYAVNRCTEEYAQALDGARRAADAAQLGPADRRAFLSYLAVTARNRILAEATDRRDREVYYANRQLTEWRRTMGARQRTIPQSLHQFDEG